MGLRSVVAFIRWHKKKISFSAILCIIIYYIRKVYMHYVKPITDMMGQEDLVKLVKTMFDEQSSNVEDQKFSKYQRVSDNTVQNTLSNLKTTVTGQYNLDAIIAKLKAQNDDEERHKSLDSSESPQNTAAQRVNDARDPGHKTPELMKELVIECWSKCILSVILVHVLYLIHRLHLNLIGRRSIKGGEVSDEDMIEFLKATNYLQEPAGIGKMKALVDRAVTNCFDKVEALQQVGPTDLLVYVDTIKNEVLIPLKDAEKRRELLFSPRGTEPMNECVSSLTDEIEDLAESPQFQKITIHLIGGALAPCFKGLPDEQVPLPKSIAVLNVLEKNVFEGNNSIFEEDAQVHEFCRMIWNA
eukprot:GEMP01048266.1.p1 GENE.GEMP01048266.1~~GEMP01048266.1.p1  ORF type:complete len:357 (+),score=54.01 GEMP01048266.1:35-1105(+)